MAAVILGHGEREPARCFDEIAAAVGALTDRDVCFNASATRKPPPGSIVYNFENVPGQITHPAELWAGHEVWDFSARNAAQYGATHVPVGYHPSMERFERKPPDEQDVDVVFCGCLNERRVAVLTQLAEAGLTVAHVPPGIYGAERDAVLARSKLALNMLFYEDGVFPALRVAHLVANRVPVLSERCPEMWRGMFPTCAYADLVERAVFWSNPKYLPFVTPEEALDAFKAQPLVLP